MDAISSVSTPALDVVQAALSRKENIEQTALAVAAKAQEIQTQQGAAAVSLIEAAGHSLVDVRV
ncbi:hypothetical protein COW36_14075 [bacterium (Candidatus Blackallbacteria) CG17_big_fil_post_rev_8_21_14_2_50_48_46]|uniref:Motility protein n=1 Tax=bacterium (Candidatus Blackallbacteria) CG17_big_fil_post_rev_8_21_14_2_50_48_46 TaxID=2014261 RepID=A0A2M7G350_9BACT|nr:MAG: hypothetical protein COW64_23545 [bacterium (Candidatus Blackallbacteria) CG18_big_fil_WC_8_21_14_2_50_49_26]PIW16248.1 MAG: hypothetical protein COW36_14075 [bacterium (Candidatus Blackallbacteria) CG17_big_fil_post_rev_8_21_14_2_50_48_46]PIW49871.1 MAG: hypothetical protein COW20_04230 [bacterium (Candidatus Blackallbacteria) CG13_big_fil_rev_8_21_14_2_50_49_14]